jgi:predicted ATPase
LYQLPGNFSTISAKPLDFHVVPESEPPSNVHVVIGSNGVGKTLLLGNMARAITSGDTTHGNFEFDIEDSLSVSNKTSFAGVVSVSFSAFDQFVLPHSTETSSPSIRYEYVGLRVAEGLTNDKIFRPKSPQELASEFATSSGTCRIGAKVERWNRALEALESDLIFRQKSISDIAFQSWNNDLDRRNAMIAFFDELSSGHKLVLLTITRLVEVVEEGTLVLLDEPEAHLHPPLLATFVRALSELLMNRNGVAIIATHSPVVLQEVPARCVWKLYRLGDHTEALRPEIETFGENVGVLTREVFSLEVTESGFHKTIANRVALSSSYEDAVRAFGGQLGGEARALLRALMIEKESHDEL